MTDKLILQHHPDGVAVLIFNRPESRNALDLATMRRFADTIAALREDQALRVLVLAGAGEQAFCSGGDLLELSSYPAADEGAAMSALMGDALLALERLPVPVIAAVNGYALGGGSEIALACELRIVDENVRFGLVQIRMGLTPGWGAGQRLLRLVGYSRALDILLRGQAMQAEELVALGLVNQVVAAGTALPHALERARQIAAAPPDVVRGIKALLQAGLNQPYADALNTERDLFPALWAADAHLDAVAHFLRSRKP